MHGREVQSGTEKRDSGSESICGLTGRMLCLSRVYVVHEQGACCVRVGCMMWVGRVHVVPWRGACSAWTENLCIGGRHSVHGREVQRGTGQRDSRAESICGLTGHMLCLSRTHVVDGQGE